MTVSLAKWSLSDYHRILNAGALVDRQIELFLVDIVDMTPEGSLHAAADSIITKFS